ncbi:sensor histidine kinase [Streptodolium elevatio]
MLVPSIALMAVWGTYTYGRYDQAADLRQTLDDVQRVAVKGELAMVSMQEERRLSMEFLAGNAVDRARLDGQRQATDQALGVMNQAAGPVVERHPPELKRTFEQITAGLGGLPAFRQQVDARQVGPDAAFQFYSGALEGAMGYFEAQVRSTNDTKTATEAGTAAALFRALEYLARQNAVLSAGVASPTGLSVPQRAQFDQLVGAQRAQYAFVRPQLRGAQAARYEQILAGRDWALLKEAENSASGRTGRVAVDAAALHQAMLSTAQQLQQLTLDQVEFARGYGRERIDDLTTSVILVGALTLASILLAVLISVLVSRALLLRLRGLRDSTRRLANEQLPNVVGRLQRGEKVDPAEVGSDFDQGRDEIGEVARAFDEAQRTAIRAAIEQAETRQGVSRVFLNIAHRSQGLVHRQLALLDEMEREHEDPDLLAELFRVDHLATRMRRNAENLSVLGGTMPARRWRRPVMLAEILRGAASQTEDYSRVKLTMVPEAGLAGPVAGDVMHLLSELVENAATFSPPHTKVRISAELVPNGLGIEIEDRGLGMAAEAREEANKLLDTAPEFNVMGFTTDTRLGLFVVARLAHRHGISVSLRSSPYGGTSAVVLLPLSLLGAAGDPGDSSHVGAAGDPTDPRAGTAGAGIAGNARPVAVPGYVSGPQPAPQPTPPHIEPVPTGADQGRVAVLPAPPQLPPPRAVTPTAPATTAPASTPQAAGGPSGERRLPRRVRRASLQPQLLRRTDTEAPHPDAEVEHRSAEEARQVMAAFQRGSFKGRTEAGRLQDDGGSPPYPHSAPEYPNGQGQW